MHTFPIVQRGYKFASKHCAVLDHWLYHEKCFCDFWDLRSVSVFSVHLEDMTNFNIIITL